VITGPGDQTIQNKFAKFAIRILGIVVTAFKHNSSKNHQNHQRLETDEIISHSINYPVSQILFIQKLFVAFSLNFDKDVLVYLLQLLYNFHRFYFVEEADATIDQQIFNLKVNVIFLALYI